MQSEIVEPIYVVAQLDYAFQGSQNSVRVYGLEYFERGLKNKASEQKLEE